MDRAYWTKVDRKMDCAKAMWVVRNLDCGITSLMSVQTGGDGMIYRGKGSKELSESGGTDFSGLVVGLQERRTAISIKFPNVDDICVLGIDLTMLANE